MTNFANLKWSHFNDNITKAKVSWLGEFRALTNRFYHAIEIYTDKVKKYDRYATRHTIKIACGPYGEAGEQIELPLGTKLKDAKIKAMQIATGVEAEGEYTFQS